ncbi:hypothetical protein ES288_A02G067000v1 [Gossypium darwinii]|uniref:F-box domain-containing protein n=1 Tax=Gossypium darwinii TaxID=34276 RepID=A0A5D2HBD5_GOSDA|nr:hypothetical protein ES288_A02G067000v1 [Gossypium darwinii]
MSVNWSDLPRDIFEGIIGRLGWVDRIRIRGVCKAWSVPNRHISAIHKEIPWMLTKFSWSPTNNGQNFQVSGECLLLDPVSGEYVAEESVRGEGSRVFPNTGNLSSSKWRHFPLMQPPQNASSLCWVQIETNVTSSWWFSMEDF